MSQKSRYKSRNLGNYNIYDDDQKTFLSYDFLQGIPVIIENVSDYF